MNQNFPFNMVLLATEKAKCFSLSKAVELRCYKDVTSTVS